jgi:hypothetical protein
VRFSSSAIFSLLSALFVTGACKKTETTVASASASASAAPAPQVPVISPPRPRAAARLVADHEKPPLALLSMVNPVALVGRVKKPESLPRCDCERGEIEIERVIRDDSKLGLAQRPTLEIIGGSGALSAREGKRLLSILRVDDAERRVSAWYEASPDGVTEVEGSLRSAAIEFERGPGPLPPLGIVTTRDGRVIWHRQGRVALVTNLTDPEKAAADALLGTYGALGASEIPRAENDAWRIRLAGVGSVMDGSVARRAVEAFAERLDARLRPNRELWQSSAVVVGKLGAKPADAGAPDFVVEKVLKNRSGETLAADDHIELDATDVPKEKSVLLFSSFQREPGKPLAGKVFRVLPASAEESTTTALEELARHSLSGK